MGGSSRGPGAHLVHLWPPHFAFSDHHPWDLGSHSGPALLVSLASEVQDLHLAQRKEMASGFSKGPNLGLLPDVPSLLETLSYSYCYVGIMTGPFFRYRTYLDWLEQPFPGAVPSLRPLLCRAWPAPLFGLLFLLSSHLFPLEAVREDAFYARPLPDRLFYMIPVFFAFRMRFYVAWIAAECGCIAAGFGAYPVAAKARPGGGPTLQCPPPSSLEKAASVEYNYETIRNIDCYDTDFCTRVREGMRHWNMTVQWWLAQYIYKSAPFRSYVLRTEREKCRRSARRFFGECSLHGSGEMGEKGRMEAERLEQGPRVQERLDHAAERLLARPPPWLLPKLPDHPAVPGGRGPVGVCPAGTAQPRGPEGLGLGALVPEDASLRLHVHGLCAALAGRHPPVLGVCLLLHPHPGPGGPGAGAGFAWGQPQPEEDGVAAHQPCPGKAPGGVSCRNALSVKSHRAFAWEFREPGCLLAQKES
nr:lysophospholipid acyltransferase 7 isoform X2 [Equus caballus]XP_023506131.1 lysophospholipid acyltransferase 7 isoform X2 [Equus caballus]XP_023506132.1 lysophospholipid acyltransferase 7 isoform X2 [Equus caballus]XP_023506133.1 lysophospholipid acyltransferase 7 isoform X2 [Equus caballus]XP_023506134.1 lysophospholipid acyltransferase 7 isoform X2 [Equus caballus]